MRWNGPAAIQVNGAPGDTRAPLLVSMGRNMLGRMDTLARGNPRQATVSDRTTLEDGSYVIATWTPYVKSITVSLVGVHEEGYGIELPEPYFEEEYEYYEPMYNGLVVEETEVDDTGAEVTVSYLYTEDPETGLVKYDRVTRGNGRPRKEWKQPEGHHVLPVKRGNRYDFLSGEDRQLGTNEFPSPYYPLKAGKSDEQFTVRSSRRPGLVNDIFEAMRATRGDTARVVVLSYHEDPVPKVYDRSSPPNGRHTRFDVDELPDASTLEFRTANQEQMLEYTVWDGVADPAPNRVRGLINSNGFAGSYYQDYYNNFLKGVLFRGYIGGPHWVYTVDLFDGTAESITREEILGPSVVMLGDIDLPGVQYVVNRFNRVNNSYETSNVNVRDASWNYSVETVNSIPWEDTFLNITWLYYHRMPIDTYLWPDAYWVYDEVDIVDRWARDVLDTAYQAAPMPFITGNGAFDRNSYANVDNETTLRYQTYWIRPCAAYIPYNDHPVLAEKKSASGSYYEKAEGTIGIGLSLDAEPTASLSASVYRRSERVSLYTWEVVEESGNLSSNYANTGRGTVTANVDVVLTLNSGTEVPVKLVSVREFEQSIGETVFYLASNNTRVLRSAENDDRVFEELPSNIDDVYINTNCVAAESESPLLENGLPREHLMVGGVLIDLTGLDRRLRYTVYGNYFSPWRVGFQWVSTQYPDYTLLTIIWTPDKSYPVDTRSISYIGETEEDVYPSVRKLFVAATFVVPTLVDDATPYIEGRPPEETVLRVKTPEHLFEDYGVLDVDVDDPTYNELPDYAIVNPITGEVVPVFLDEEGEPDVKGCFVRHGDAEYMFRKLPPGQTGPIRVKIK